MSILITANKTNLVDFALYGGLENLKMVVVILIMM